jgi:hypothetical protein
MVMRTGLIDVTVYQRDQPMCLLARVRLTARHRDHMMIPGKAAIVRDNTVGRRLRSRKIGLERGRNIIREAE